MGWKKTVTFKNMKFRNNKHIARMARIVLQAGSTGNKNKAGPLHQILQHRRFLLKE